MTQAKQGHTYQLGPIKVMAMTSGEFPTLHTLDTDRPWPLQYMGKVNASALVPLPMTYFGGKIP
jgi:hypothetical protein